MSEAENVQVLREVDGRLRWVEPSAPVGSEYKGCGDVAASGVCTVCGVEGCDCDLVAADLRAARARRYSYADKLPVAGSIEAAALAVLREAAASTCEWVGELHLAREVTRRVHAFPGSRFAGQRSLFVTIEGPTLRAMVRRLRQRGWGVELRIVVEDGTGKRRRLWRLTGERGGKGVQS